MKRPEQQNTPSASGNAPDVAKKANLVIWFYFFIFGITLYGMILLVDIYFRIQSDKEYYIKTGSVVSKELTALREFEKEVMQGKRGVVEGKKNISIEDAMAKVIRVVQ